MASKNLPALVPPRTPEMEAFVPAAIRSELDESATRMVIQALINQGADPLNTLSAGAPVSAKVRKSYEWAIGRFSATLDIPEENLLDLDSEHLQAAVIIFLSERAQTVTTGTLNHDRKAIAWWASRNGLANPVSDAAKLIKGSKKSKGKGQLLNDGELRDLFVGLKSGEVITNEKTRLSVRVGWHLRMRAAYLIAITCSLRLQSELPMFCDKNILGTEDDGTIHVLLPSPKGGKPVPKSIRPRTDEFCPVAALRDFHEWIDRSGLDRPEGLLLPHVKLRRTEENTLSATGNESLLWIQYLRPFLEAKGHDTTSKYPHSFRSEAISAAVEEGWSIDLLLDLGGWASIDTAVGYDRSGGVEFNFHGGDR